jgi:hypothetical protein
MIIALAGRRIDAEAAEEERFPLKNADQVSREIKARFEALNPNVLICSAACGADLIALVIAQQLGIRRHIVLPFPPQRFRETSVVDRNSTWNWGRIFDALSQEAKESDDLIIVPPADDETAAYALTNERIISEAIELSSEDANPENTDERYQNILALIVWEGRSRGDDDLTAEFADRARAKGIAVEQVYTVHSAG